MSLLETFPRSSVPRDPRGFLCEVLSHVRDRPVLARVELPTDPVDFPQLVAARMPQLITSLGHSTVWGEPSRGNYFASWGSTETLRPRGASRISDLCSQASALFRRIEPFFYGGRGPGAQLVGGLAFAEGGSGGSWRGFGDGRFVLPRWELRVQSGRAWLCLNVDFGKETNEVAALEEYDALCEALHNPPALSQVHDSAMERARHMPVEAWCQLVEAAKKAIDAADLHKVVLARRSVVETTRTLDAQKVLLNLERTFPGCFLFSFEGDSESVATTDRMYFVGASPERLVSLQGHDFYADALAGSVDPARPDAEGWLRDSEKDRQEHAFVVDEIVERVRLLCTELDVPAEPTLKRLRNIVHLHTPIRGHLRSRLHVLELLSILHPTPAVCGVPVDRARAWIEQNERMGRGWYAGPVGWFDESGQGEFAVALRSGLIGSRRAELFAGGGIVRDSDPMSEYDETSAKLNAMLCALGLGTAQTRPTVRDD